jgi:hypothetical protein
VWGCVSNSVATTPISAPRKIKEVLRITPTTDWYQWEHRPCGAASVQDQELPIAAKWVCVNQPDFRAAPAQGVASKYHDLARSTQSRQ